MELAGNKHPKLLGVLLPTTFFDDIINRFDVARKPFWDYEIANAMSMLPVGNLTEGELQRFRDEVFPWSLGTRHNRGSCWGTYFAPAYEGVSANGFPEVQPDIASLTRQSLQVWLNRLRGLRHPVLIARYADLLWDLGSLIDPQSKRDHQMGRSAADAYLNVAAENLAGDDLRKGFVLRRGFELSTELNDEARRTIFANALLSLAESAQLHEIGIWSIPSDTFESSVPVPHEINDALIHILENRLADSSRQCNGYAAEVASHCLLKLYKRGSHALDRQRVSRVYANTFVRQATTAPPGVAIAWLDSVAHAIEKEGLHEEVEAIRLQMEKLGPASVAMMKTYTVQIDINEASLQKELDEVIDARHPMIALLRLARHLIPKSEHLRAQVAKAEIDFPFYSIISRSIVGEDGIPRATIGSSDTDLEERMVEEATREFQLIATFFKIGYDKVKLRFAFSADDLTSICTEEFLIRPEGTAQLKQAIEAYESEDYLKMLSISLPLIEGTMRELLTWLQVPIRKSVRTKGGSTTEMKNLNDVLSDHRVVDTLDEDLVFFLRTLLIDKRSYNLRNEFAHGTLPPHAYNWATASLAMIVLVVLMVIGPSAVYLAPADAGN